MCVGASVDRANTKDTGTVGQTRKNRASRRLRQHLHVEKAGESMRLH